MNINHMVGGGLMSLSVAPHLPFLTLSNTTTHALISLPNRRFPPINAQPFFSFSSTFRPSFISAIGISNCSPSSGEKLPVKVLTAPQKNPEARVLNEEVFPHIQTLRRFPLEELSSKVVMVRFDSSILIQQKVDRYTRITSNILETIKNIYNAGAKVILTSSWNVKHGSKILSVEDVSELLSLMLQLSVAPAQNMSELQRFKMARLVNVDIILFQNLSNYKQEHANDSDFSRNLASGIDIFVNDSFSSGHKILASTVGVTQFCYASLAGFYFEECLQKLKNITECRSRYVAVIGGDDIINKTEALQFLTSRCDGLVFVGMMGFQIMHALGVPLPSNLVEQGVSKAATEVLEYAKRRNIPLLLPKDFQCKHYSYQIDLKTFHAHGILDGWEPVDLGTNSLDEIASFLSSCKKILWIGPVKFKKSDQTTDGASKLVLMLDELSKKDCDVTVVGHMACQAVTRISRSALAYDMIENASVVWEFLKGRNLPGLVALDRAYPFSVDWNTIYCDPVRPVAVDIGSGNGMFLTGMATLREDLNFLGLEINEKLVTRCQHSIHQSGLKNLHFIATNATSTFRSIISSYPGPLILVSIQCPNPDFNEPEHRWRMIQRSLIEAIADLLTSEGKVFLQSDVKEVALRMKKQFLEQGKGKLAILHDDDNNNGDGALSSTGWLKENPFGVPSDWERHVIARGAPMYRTMLSKR